MSQCLFVNANIIEPNDEELNHKQAMIEKIGRDEVLKIWKVVDIRSERKIIYILFIIINAISFLCSCLKSISRGVICHHYFCVMMNSKTAAFHISMITQLWYKDIYQDGINPQESVVLNCERDAQNNDSIYKGILPTQCPVTILTTVPMLRKAIRKRNLYGHKKINETPAIKKKFMIDEIKRLADGETPTNDNTNSDTSVKLESSNQMEKDKPEQDDEIIKTNLETVKNPNKAVNKDHPSKQRYLSSVEKEQKLEALTDVTLSQNFLKTLMIIMLQLKLAKIKIHEFRAHSTILRARLPYFKSALSNQWAYDKKYEIILFTKSNITSPVFIEPQHRRFPARSSPYQYVDLP
ncbi:hypothetical protein Glove_85g100 [Diversispora epigaea]|uniref:SWIM-type domain-containing protein n=1 Tax=Diversispora epigaea TaxID=1348612 RepID=A0A397JGK7_9GLOM|nr:hypothetical protein Glove_85g100 [Diversispora epigaea]